MNTVQSNIMAQIVVPMSFETGQTSEYQKFVKNKTFISIQNQMNEL